MGVRTAEFSEAVARAALPTSVPIIDVFGQRTAQAGASIARPSFTGLPAPRWGTRRRLIGAGWLERLYDPCQSYVLSRRTGAGTITEADGVLTLSIGSGANCPAWGSNPFAYYRLPRCDVSFDTVLKIETRLYSYTMGVAAGAGLVVYQDASNAYLFQCYSADSKLYVSRIYGGGGSNVANTGAVAAPGTSPHTYRIYFNPTVSPLPLQELDGLTLTVNGGETQFWYRVGDAGTWTLLHTRQMEWSINGLLTGPFSYNGSPWPATTALYNYLSIYQWDAAMQIMVPIRQPVRRT